MSEDKIISWQELERIEQEKTFNKNLLFLHDLVVCPNCAVKVRVKMEAIE